jgi:hypothetical protein
MVPLASSGHDDFLAITGGSPNSRVDDQGGSIATSGVLNDIKPADDGTGGNPTSLSALSSTVGFSGTATVGAAGWMIGTIQG